MFLKAYIIVLLVSIFVGICVKVVSIAKDDDGQLQQAERAISLVLKTIMFIWGIVELTCLLK